MKTNTLTIRTPEGVVFSQVLAGPVVRFGAWFVDGLVISALMMIPSIFARIVFLVSADVAQALVVISYFVFSVGYGMVCEWFWRGQTVGKRVFRLRVMDGEGLRLQFSQIAIRNLLRVVDILPICYMVGGAVCWITRKNQRLGDIAAGTVVIRHPDIAEPDIEDIFLDKYNSLRGHPHLAARLRQQVTPLQAAVALQALLRRDDFEPEARVELFTGLAQTFRRMVEFPGEAIDGIADEQYVRNVVDILYRTPARVAASRTATEPLTLSR